MSALSSPNTLGVLGSSPEAFYVACGRRHVVENMPASFTKHANSALSVAMMLWISMGRSMEHWVDFKTSTEDFHFDGNPEKAVLDDLGHQRQNWVATLPDYFVKNLALLQREVPAVANSLTGMLFGKENINIYLYPTGFLADLDGEAEADNGHPLNKVCKEMKEGRCIECGSTLCFHDSRYFFLKFKRPGTNTIRMRWNLPPHVGAKPAELQAIAEQPDELIAIQQEDEKWAQVASQRINAQVASHEREPCARERLWGRVRRAGGLRA
ncbi:hypothetical protein DFH09DRAFT_1365431 [Mycena vulgaris]|nr:hypothetical protein DFH09DRAFT_1365431 [Mycena vulgaris]